MPELPNELKKMEAALAGLTPATGWLNRDRLLYEAGRRAARPGIAPIFATMFAGLSAVLALQLALRSEPPPRVVELVRTVPSQVSSTEPQSKTETIVAHTGAPEWGNAFRSSTGYLSQRDRAVYFGTDTLRSAALPPAPSKPSEFDDDALPGRTWHRPL